MDVEHNGLESRVAVQNSGFLFKPFLVSLSMEITALTHLPFMECCLNLDVDNIS